MSDLQSSFEPGSPKGKQLFRSSYRRVRNQLRIDPIREGKALRRRVVAILTRDPLGLRDPAEQANRRREADELVTRYEVRSRKFWAVYQQLNYTEGQQRALKAMRPFITDADQEEDRLAKKKTKIEAV